MPITISSAADAAVDQMFTALDGVLQKAAEHARASGADEETYLNWRIAPDMFPLIRQVQVATEMPARSLSRLAEADLPSFVDDERTFGALRDRIVKARAYIKGLSADALDADPDKNITFPVGPDNEMTLPRRAYLQTFILPNLYFHVAAAYLILRRLGVPIGKRDFLAAPA